MSNLKLYLLGAPRVELDGLYVEINRNKGMALLASLAFTGEPHRRVALGTLLWPERSQRNARENLRRELWLLRAALTDEWLIADREMIGLRHNSHFWLDVDQFQRGLKSGSAEPRLLQSTHWAMLAASVQLYRGDFLSGFTLPNCPAFDEWQFFQTEHLRRELAAALEELVIRASAQGHGETAID